MKEFKPGVLVMLKHDARGMNPLCLKFVGTYHVLKERSLKFPKSWRMMKPLRIEGSSPQVVWHEDYMKVIDPDDSPSEETLYAPLKKATPVRKDTLKESEHV